MKVIRLVPSKAFGYTGISREEALAKILEDRQRYAPSASSLKPEQLERFAELSSKMHLPARRLIHVSKYDMLATSSLIDPCWSMEDDSTESYSFPTVDEARYLSQLYRELFEEYRVTNVAVIVYGDPHQFYDLIEVEYADPAWERRVVHIPLTVVADFDRDENPE